MTDNDMLKAWVHWKRKEGALLSDDREFIDAVDNLLNECAGWKAEVDTLRHEFKTLQREALRAARDAIAEIDKVLGEKE